MRDHGVAALVHEAHEMQRPAEAPGARQLLSARADLQGSGGGGKAASWGMMTAMH